MLDKKNAAVIADFHPGKRKKVSRKVATATSQGVCPGSVHPSSTRETSILGKRREEAMRLP